MSDRVMLAHWQGDWSEVSREEAEALVARGLARLAPDLDANGYDDGLESYYQFADECSHCGNAVASDESKCPSCGFSE